MSVLVFGANGQLGHELVARASSHPVVGLSREQADITKPESIATALARYRPQLAINAAAYTAVDRAEQEPERADAINHLAVANLARACRDRDIPLFHVSTDYVFDGQLNRPYREDDPVCPLGHYGLSKLLGERVLRDTLEQHLILRVSWVFGAHGNNFARTMLRLGRERQRLRVVADQLGGPTPAGAIAETLLALAERYLQQGALSWGLYHFCGEPATSWHGFASAVVERGHRLGLLPWLPLVEAIATEEYPTPARRPANSRLDCRRFHETFGLSLPDWRDGLDEILGQWAREGF